MPPRVRYTPERIIDAGLGLVRRDGIEALSARNLAGALGCSTGPLFSHFDNMDAITEAVVARAMAAFVERATREADQGQDPVVGASLGWLAFAAEEPRLYEALFLRRHPWHARWGAIRLELAARMADHPAYSALDQQARFALVGRASMVLHGVGLELWSGRLRADTPQLRRELVQQLVLPVIAAAVEGGWHGDFHSRGASPSGSSSHDSTTPSLRARSA